MVANKERDIENITEFADKIKEAAEEKVIYTEHALDEMNAEDEMISKDEVRQVISEGDIIENYPEDKRGHSCLMFSYSSKARPIHIVCAPKDEYLGIITAYVPTLEKWENDFRTRRQE